MAHDAADTLALTQQPVITTDDQKLRAARTVAEFATGVDDARELLDALGLLIELPTLRPRAA